jgi:hypothetical protein
MYNTCIKYIIIIDFCLQSRMFTFWDPMFCRAMNLPTFLLLNHGLITRGFHVRMRLQERNPRECEGFRAFKRITCRLMLRTEAVGVRDGLTRDVRSL